MGSHRIHLAVFFYLFSRKLMTGILRNPDSVARRSYRGLCMVDPGLQEKLQVYPL
jgi:hypothetical protein